MVAPEVFTSFVEEFRKHLEERAYAAGSVLRYEAAARRLVEWARVRGVDPRLADPGMLKLFAAGQKGARRRQSLRALADFLAGPEAVPPKILSDPGPTLLTEYCQWASCHRGTKDSTLAGYIRELRLLLEKVGDRPADFTARSIRDFILERAEDFPSGDAQKPISAVRGFLRFLASTGQMDASRVGAVPTLAHWRLQRLTPAIGDRDVDRLLESCDRRTALGLRDYAILLVLARLALRPGDVAQLRLADVDWRHACLRVSGKTRRAELLPLPQEVGDAILRYLDRSRPPRHDDHLFLRVQAPVCAMTRHGVSDVVRRAIRRSGIQAPQHGAYLLRHSAATSLLARGHSLKAIGTLLRHRSFETTALYTKLDLKLLQSVAQPWPEEVRS